MRRLKFPMALLVILPALAVTAEATSPSIEQTLIRPLKISGDGSTLAGGAALVNVWKRGTSLVTNSPLLACWQPSYDGSFVLASWPQDPNYLFEVWPDLAPDGFEFWPFAISGDASTYVGLLQHLGEYQYPNINIPPTAQIAKYSIEGGFEVVGERFLWNLDSLSQGAWNVSSDGSIVVGNQVINGQDYAFRWTHSDGLQILGLGRAGNISSDGSTIVGVDGSGVFRWTAATGLVTLGPTYHPDYEHWGVGVSADGSIVVSGELFWSTATGSRSLEEVLSNWYGLDISGWGALYASDVSDDGRTIVGYDPFAETTGIPSWMVKWGWVVTLPKPGDANSDELVDGSDYTVWADSYLLSGRNWQTGDFNGDGLVDGADYTIWADNWFPYNVVGTQAVPEPAAFTSAYCGMISCLLLIAVRRLR